MAFTIRPIKRIAVIGSGPSGVTAAKILTGEGAFAQIDVFEQQNTTDGVWNYVPEDITPDIQVPQLSPDQPLERPIWRLSVGGERQFLVSSPMYDDLESNIPCSLMAFSSKPFPKDTQLYPPLHSVSEYLREYASDVKHLIKFQAQVIDIRTNPLNLDVWNVKYQDLVTSSQSVKEYDAVCVATGHYTVPYIPDVKGIDKWNRAYPKTILHSKFYKTPKPWSEKKIVVVGFSASGRDIANHISHTSRRPVVISQRLPSPNILNGSSSTDGPFVFQPEIEEFLDPSLSNRAIRFANGHIESGIDAVLYCTGYLYSFPFLSSLKQDIVKDGLRVHNVYQHMFCVDRPSLAFMCLPIRILPFPLSEVQASVLARVWSGRLALPTEAAMRAWEDRNIAELGNGRNFHILENLKDLEYHNELYDWAVQANPGSALLARRWTDKDFWLRKRFADIRRAFVDRGEERHQIRTVEELGFDYKV